MELAEKVVIVTGAGGAGCGRAIARRMARDGAAVVACDINDAGARETARHIESDGGRAAALAADVGVASEVTRLVEFAESTFGGIDVLVNNASAPFRTDSPLEHWMEPIQVDLLGPMCMTLAVLPSMQRRGGGAIVNIGSTSALGHGRKHSQWPAYDVAKAGVIRLTTTLAWLAHTHHVRVNCLVPAWIATPEVKTYYDSLTADERSQRGAPDSLITLDEVADAVVRLATDEALAGRVMVWWNGEPPRLITPSDPGYAALE
jgi:NAD(P)-dependent dehydrogenase (short-subunit alcohol dehydrogenase family)